MRYDWIAHALICGLTTYAFGWPVGLGIGIAKEVWDLAAKRWPCLRIPPLVTGTGWSWADILADVVGVGLALSLI